MDMDCLKIIEQLGYKDNPAFLQGEQLKEHPGYSYFFTQAQKDDHCKLRGVYILDGPMDKILKSSITPVVYVCEADNENEASTIHRRVWNQNTVPFLMVITPKNIRLYSGFEYDRKKTDEQRLLRVARNAQEVLERLSAFTSKTIDSGEIWDKWKITNEKRVDRHLLKNLKKLTETITGTDYKLSPEDAHTLIGKYIYLRYLRDRDILSNRKLFKEGLTESDIFGRKAKKEKLYQIEGYLNRFLNGKVFPLPSKSQIRSEHIQKVASVFKGDDPNSSQQVLFDLYDFSYIPVETLSVVYQQFLHEKDKGRDKGAYYTPVHLVNFMLDELEVKTPLIKGMKIFDPSCGSGAFLVQCYRRLVEGNIRKEKQKLKPSDLRGLLEEYIFGLDADEEACRVAELSLSLTLLDYIQPPDLETYPTFQLPDLHNKNIFHCEGGFFDLENTWTKNIPQNGYDWIVGNPPWKNIDKKKSTEQCDTKTVKWIDDHKAKYPVDNYQTAEAFVWKVSEILSDDGQCGLLMPAMTLFKTQGHRFRSKFFTSIEVWCVVNFANLRHLLFEGAVNPAAAFFFSGKKEWRKSEHYITTYAPFAAEQSYQLNQKESSKKLWAVFVTSTAIKEIPLIDIEDGSSPPWKMAMWGSNRDRLLINRIAHKYGTLKEFVKNHKLLISEGLQLRTDCKNRKELELVNEIRGKDLLEMEKLKGCGAIYSFSCDHFKKIETEENIYTRKGRKNLPLSICNPPHIFIDASRRFIVYSDKFFVIPARQIGIAGEKAQSPLLKALAIYLKSEYFQYQQWLTCAGIGIERDISNFDDLKKLPMPLFNISEKELADLVMLHDEIVAAGKREEREGDQTLWSNQRNKLLPKLDELLRQLNDKVYKFLGINKKQQWLIEDLLNVRIKMNDGKIAKEIIQPASEKEIAEFVRIFQDELDLFLDHTGQKRVHQVKVYYTDYSAVLVVEHLRHVLHSQPEIIEVKDQNSRQIFNGLQDKLTEKKSQWMYFNRSLRIYEGRRTYIFKPRQRLYWLKSQALAGADEFIAEKVGDGLPINVKCTTNDK